jgi:hypothetical protein
MKTKYALEDMKRLAHEYGGECLSDAYANTKTKLHWQCSEGHMWAAIPDSVLRGHWCEVCGNVRQGRMKAKSIENAQSLAKARGGECLSKKYKNNSTPLHWKCGTCSHEWDATESSVQQGKWCPKCAGRLSPEEALAELRILAAQKGGECLSECYLGARAKHRWRCAEGHEWEAPRYSIQAGTWCKKCAGNERLTLEDMQDTARKFGGVCLSTEYINIDEQLQWCCAEGHEWWAVGYHVRAGHWCPTCASGNSERICRAIFEQMFGRPFPKAKPAWLTNSRGKRMELDGYCKELQVAFEYHGVQHYKYINYFHREAGSLNQRQLDDEHKERLCLKHVIHLFVIPFTVSASEIPGFVARLAQEKELALRIGNPRDVVVGKFALPHKQREMQELAGQKGGQCLSATYINNNTPLQWECSKGHRWKAVPGSIQQGTWCPKCVGRLEAAEALKELQEIARFRGGECLAESYVNGSTKLLWRCSEGHAWNSAPNYIRGGSWCPVCAKKVQGPKRMALPACQAAAAARGGQCLSDTYVNTDTKLRWRCGDCGHIWEAIPYTVVRLGTWCPKCKGKRNRKKQA